MDKILTSLFIVIICLVVYWAYRKSLVTKRAKWIDTFRFPATIEAKIIEKYPHLNQQEAAQVIEGLREYFHICNIAGKKMVSMPSQAVDVAWHEFIIFTRRYKIFCDNALGRFLHHTPAEAMQSPTIAQEGIKITWKIACHRENIEPKSPYKLPILFAIDAALNIPDGFRYSLDCTKPGNNGYCASHVGCGGCTSCGGDSSGCGGGCGGG